MKKVILLVIFQFFIAIMSYSQTVVKSDLLYRRGDYGGFNVSYLTYDKNGNGKALRFEYSSTQTSSGRDSFVLNNLDSGLVLVNKALTILQMPETAREDRIEDKFNCQLIGTYLSCITITRSGSNQKSVRLGSLSFGQIEADTLKKIFLKEKEKQVISK
jgi:hypothetical protein